MKYRGWGIFLAGLVLGASSVACARGVTLLEVYQQALVHDPVWLQAVSQARSDQQGVPISLAALLPAVSAALTPTVSRYLSSGPAVVTGSGSSRGYTLQLTLSQTVFDFAAFSELASQHALSARAAATLNAALQDLIIRVSSAYFQVLNDEENLVFLAAARKAYTQQRDQTREQYRAGVKTLTDVYTARAAWASSVADSIGAEATLQTDRENLRAITGQLYPALAGLRADFPLVRPVPARMDKWVVIAGQHNWKIRAATYQALSKKRLVGKAFAGHLPTLDVGGSWSDAFSRTSSHVDEAPSGAGRTETTTGLLTLTMPLLAGGGVMAETRQAKEEYAVAMHQLEAQRRTVLTQTRQSYLNVIAGISRIRADREAVHSTRSSLQGMQAGLRVGTEVLFNVLNQQQNVYEAQSRYSADRFAWINNLLALKEAAGTLSVKDLVAINRWLK